MAIIKENLNLTSEPAEPLVAKTGSLRFRVALLTNIPAPYRLEMFRLLGERCDLKVFFDTPSEPNRSWRLPSEFPFRHKYLKSTMIPYLRKRSDNGLRERRYYQVSWRTYFALRQFLPDVVISGEMGFRTLQASVYASLHKVPLIIWSEGTPHTEGWANSKERVRRYLTSRATRFWSNGRESSQLLIHYGACAQNIDQPMIGTDTRRHWKQVQEARAGRHSLRSALGLQGTVFLFVGQFQRRKGILEYLDTLEHLQRSTSAPFSALFIGDGPERATLEQWIRLHPAIRARTLEFQQPDQLCSYYAACDVFVLPSLDDNWSLVTLEAASAGMPQIFSVCNGASADLQSFQAAGVCVDPRNIETFAEALKNYAEHLPAWSPDSTTQRIVSYFSSEAWATRACDSIQLAAAASHVRA